MAGNIIQRNFKAGRATAEMDNGCNTVSFLMGKMLPFPILDMNTNEIISYDLSMILILTKSKDAEPSF